MEDQAKKWLEHNQNSYDAIAEEFSLTRHYVWRDSQVFMEYINDGDKVLDLGCGNGRLVDLLTQKKIEYLGVDFSSGLIETAEFNYPLLSFQKADALTMDLGKTFDAIVSVSVLNHIPAPFNDSYLHDQFINSAKKHLKSGGHLLLSNWNLWGNENKKGVASFQLEKNELSEEDFFQKFKTKKELVGPQDVLTVWGSSMEVLYYYAFTVEELVVLLEKNGFEIIKSYYSKNGAEVEKEVGDNIIVIAKLP